MKMKHIFLLGLACGIAVGMVQAPTASAESSEVKQEAAVNAPSDAPLTRYVACGCGCCGGVEEMGMAQKCVADEAALLQVQALDKETANMGGMCATMGCAAGVVYSICQE